MSNVRRELTNEVQVAELSGGGSLGFSQDLSIVDIEWLEDRDESFENIVIAERVQPGTLSADCPNYSSTNTTLWEISSISFMSSKNRKSENQNSNLMPTTNITDPVTE